MQNEFESKAKACSCTTGSLHLVCKEYEISPFTVFFSGTTHRFSCFYFLFSPQLPQALQLPLPPNRSSSCFVVFWRTTQKSGPHATALNVADKQVPVLQTLSFVPCSSAHIIISSGHIPHGTTKSLTSMILPFVHLNGLLFPIPT